MTDQDFWFEPVSLLTECSLNEAVLWIWADRVPVSNAYREKNAFETLTAGECERLNIPPVPEGIGRVAHYRTEERLRRTYAGMKPKDALEYHVERGLQEAAAVREWLPRLTAEIELPAVELFLRLRRGEISAQGKLLPPNVQIIDFVEQERSYSRSDFDELRDTSIPPDFWTMPGIDWIANAMSSRGQCYCDVHRRNEHRADHLYSAGTLSTSRSPIYSEAVDCLRRKRQRFSIC
jgi:hypothetical protein